MWSESCQTHQGEDQCIKSDHESGELSHGDTRSAAGVKQSVGEKIQECDTAYYLPAREHAQLVRIFFEIADDHQHEPCAKSDVEQQAHRDPGNVVAEQRRSYRSSFRTK